MSGIVGLIQLDGQGIDPLAVVRMIEAVSHHGPDGSGIWRGKHVALGHQMLRVTNEFLTEQLPLASASGAYVLTADARIDNRAELIGELGINQATAELITDSALILAAYERWGVDCVQRLVGDFAFAIWDEREQRLFCARDHFGVRPLYYYHGTGCLAFASELKAILQLGFVPTTLNDERIADFLIAEDDLSSTLYARISRLPPAHTLIARAEGTLEIERYWALDPSRELRLATDEEYASQLRELFTEAVRCRTRSHYPIGSMLSGGLDSSSITCVAQRLLAGRGHEPLHTFSTRFDSVSESDESCYQDLVIDRLPVQPHYLIGDEAGPLRDIQRVLDHQDEAIKAGNLYTNWHFYQLAQRHGIRVILDGFDGDSTVSHGLGYLPELANAGRWWSLAREIRSYAPKNGESWSKAYCSWAWQFGLRPPLSRHRALKPLLRAGQAIDKRLSPSGGSQSTMARASDILRPEFFERVNVEERQRARRRIATTERDAHLQRLTHPGMSRTLETLYKAAGAHSVDVRFPFWDKRLVEYCLSLPADQKISQGWTRVVMRRAMEAIVPPEIQWRGGKTDMHPSFEYSLRTFHRREIEQVIVTDPDTISSYVNIDRLTIVYRRFLAREATEHDVNALWRAVCLGLWLRRVDQPVRILI